MARTKRTEEEVELNGAEEFDLTPEEMAGEAAPSQEELEAQKEAYFAAQKAQMEEVAQKAAKIATTGVDTVSPLKATKVIVRHVYKDSPLFKGNPKNHVYAGGIAENARKIFCVPMKGRLYVRVFTEAEQAWMEETLGLQRGAMNPWAKQNNYWNSYFVELGKEDTILDLSNPEDVIKYRVLLANTDTICPSYTQLNECPSLSYMYYMVEQEDESTVMKSKVSNKFEAYKLYGRYENKKDYLRYFVEVIEGRPVGRQSIEWLQGRVGDLIDDDTKRFLKVATDKLLDTKVFIIRCVDAGLISKKNNNYYLKADNSPLCEANEESTLTVAANYLTQPKMQELYYSLSEKLQ